MRGAVELLSRPHVEQNSKENNMFSNSAYHIEENHVDGFHYDFITS